MSVVDISNHVSFVSSVSFISCGDILFVLFESADVFALRTTQPSLAWLRPRSALTTLVSKSGPEQECILNVRIDGESE